MRHHTLLLSLLSTLSLTLAACGGDSLGSDAVTAAQAEDPCRTGCEHEAECSDDPAYDLEGCVDDCVADTSGWVRGDALEALADCVADQACDASESSCQSSCEPLAEHDAYETACRATFADCLDAEELEGVCSVTPSGTSDAGMFCLVAPAIIEEMTACFDDGAACGVALECLQGVLEAHGVDL